MNYFKLTPRLIIGLNIAIIFFLLFWAFYYAKMLAINAPTFHLDGAFQTASGLFRLNAGQFPGKYFFPYLGIGPIFVLFPLFKASGANLCASLLSAQFMTLFFGGISVAVLWHLIWKPKSFTTSMMIGFIIFFMPVIISTRFSLPLYSPLELMITPGNSLRPIRAIAPYLLIIIYYLFVFNLKSTTLKSSLLGFLTGVILLWSNDFALPSAGLFALLITSIAYIKHEFTWQNISIYLFSTLLTWIGLLSAITQGHAIAILHYNFFDVLKDQWWYFGPYKASMRIFTVEQLSRLLSKNTLFSLVVLACTVMAFIKTHKIEYALVAWIGCVLFTGGALATIGGHVEAYFNGFFFWGIATVFIELFYFIFHIIPHPKLKLDFIILLLFFFTALAAAIFGWTHYELNVGYAKNDPKRFYVPELGGYLDTTWKDYIALARADTSKQVIEEYWGLWSATKKILPPWPIDSLISGLGNTRLIAEKKLQNADLIITSRYVVSPEWQPWSLSENFWFYDNLLKNWTPGEISPTTIIWHKRVNALSDESIDCQPSNNHFIVLDTTTPGFYRVEMKYALIGKGRNLLLVKNYLSYGGEVDGYVSINPAGSHAVFPVYLPGKNTLDVNTLGNPATLYLFSCSASKILLKNKDVLHVPNPDEQFFVTDNDWVNGIGRRFAGFFVQNTDENKAKYTPGKFVRLTDGKIRKITRVKTIDDTHFGVYLDGPLLLPYTLGFPSTFKIYNNPENNGEKHV